MSHLAAASVVIGLAVCAVYLITNGCPWWGLLFVICMCSTQKGQV